jgi:hypothetical protein
VGPGRPEGPLGLLIADCRPSVVQWYYRLPDVEEPAVTDETMSFVLKCVQQAFELDDFTYGPNTDLMFVSSQFDPERIEWAIEDIQSKRPLKWPRIEDRHGRLRRAQLLLPESLTVAELCRIVDSGEWPTSWTQPGKFLWL